MKMIIGLGNPGTEYARTRHNAGFMVVDRLHARHGTGEPVKSRFAAATAEVNIQGERCLLVKPLTYMNLSGRSVAEAVRFYKADPALDLLVVVDDLYLPVGKVRVRPGGGSGGHNGLESIQQLLARDDYPRLRVGVGMRPNGGKPPLMDQADFVLSRFTEEEQLDLNSSLDKAVQAAEVFVTRGLDACMNTFNAEPRPPRTERDAQGAADQPGTNQTPGTQAPGSGDESKGTERNG